MFVSYSKWNIKASTARSAELGLLILITIIAAFTVLLLVVGILSWVDYRHEECEVTEKYVAAGFRTKPRLRNFYRWYETYMILADRLRQLVHSEPETFEIIITCQQKIS